MPVTLTRIDQRFIHGITVNQWSKALHPRRFMAIDDEVSQNEMVKTSTRMSRPTGTGMSIINEEKAITNFKDGKYSSHSVFLIVKEPHYILDSINAGIEIPKVNVGASFEEGGRKPYTKRVALDEKELVNLKAIADKGIPIFSEYTPDDESEVSLTEVLKNKGEN